MTTTTSVQLRPAWRNYWLGLLLALVFAVLAVLAAVAGGGNLQPMGIAALILAAAAVLTFGVTVLKRSSWLFIVAEDTVSRSHGIIARNQQTIRRRDLRSVELSQGVFQRLFGVGDLAFYSAGSDTAEVRFFGITNPVEWKARIYGDTAERVE